MGQLQMSLSVPSAWNLPLDPVTAEDGHIYERKCIEEHFRTHQGDHLKSPMTNEKMGKKLLPSFQVRNAIGKMVESGVIDGDLAHKWKERVKLKKEMDDLLSLAEEGDTEAMCNVGNWYFEGDNGVKQDYKLAYTWFKRAHDAGNVRGTALLGVCTLRGVGVAQSESLGFIYLTKAAMQGSAMAAYCLGMAFANGMHGVSVNKAEAIHWLEKAIGEECPHEHGDGDFKNEAQQELNQLKANQPATSR
ncbi:Sel1 domain protein repeat-containing protein [Seminavis robusta]|uniref:Sel1 domain protein repeat-containing protein n=1 Tax=Seminavis robusta TaxID=568900 RepID=A0A9N8D586_9STRA|nr:Sel1 domain protein repeat-containing protein [Seminavis robusta]|eukprot:Sro3_g002900.1 Sel1 domain protein repeat-containing protein (247) ;mRNA; f:273117-273857